MRARLSIFSQGLLLLAISLVVQAVCIGLLIKTQADGARAQEWALHSKEVVAKVAEADRTLLEGYSAIRDLLLQGNPSGGVILRNTRERVPRQIEDLWHLVADNRSQQEKIQVLSVVTKQFLDWLA